MEYARLGAGETLLVTGAGGGGGTATAQIGKWRSETGFTIASAWGKPRVGRSRQISTLTPRSSTS
ncbi:MAG: hypothetical protein QOG73_1012 [Acetobacteraceae bacterium]|jgi:NADPH-dependent curcumin reductase CurA|nr:hypothetical protein [Acetobacteraceae bacterium]